MRLLNSCGRKLSVLRNDLWRNEMKLYLCLAVSMLAAASLTGCRGKNNSNNGGTGIVALQETSSQRFTPDKIQNTVSMPTVSTSKDCEKSDSPGYKVKNIPSGRNSFCFIFFRAIFERSFYASRK